MFWQSMRLWPNIFYFYTIHVYYALISNSITRHEEEDLTPNCPRENNFFNILYFIQCTKWGSAIPYVHSIKQHLDHHIIEYHQYHFPSLSNILVALILEHILTIQTQFITRLKHMFLLFVDEILIPRYLKIFTTCIGYPIHM